MATTPPSALPTMLETKFTTIMKNKSSTVATSLLDCRVCQVTEVSDSKIIITQKISISKKISPKHDAWGIFLVRGVVEVKVAYPRVLPPATL